ncbi:MAG: nascent polypeptide-associated complex protein [Methanosarcinales archaeon]
MFPGLGGRGMNPRKMAQMMKRAGIDISEIEDVEQIIIKTKNKDLIFDDATVTVVNAQGAKMYQIVGTPSERIREIEIPEADIQLVMEQTGVSVDRARAALKETKGDLAEAILNLSESTTQP